MFKILLKKIEVKETASKGTELIFFFIESILMNFPQNLKTRFIIA